MGALGWSACASQQRVALYSSDTSGNWEVYATDPTATTGTPARNLTRYPASERFPDYAPKHQTVVFSSDRQGSFNLYLMDLQGQNLRPLVPSAYPDVYPRWSPDETQIVFVSGRQDRNENLYVLKQVFSAAPELVQLTTDKAPDYDPRWHPDGQQLVFVSERSGAPELYQIAMSTGQTFPLTNTGEAKRFPVFSPQGDRLAFARQNGKQWQLCWSKVPASGVLPVPECRESGWVGDLRWQDQETLMYTEVQAQTVSVYRLRLSDGQRAPVYPEAREATN